MFNKTFITREHTAYVPYTKEIIEKRAPTDESVKLLKEFEEKALSKITEAFFIESTIAKGILLKMIQNPIDMGETVVCVFNINGKQYTVKHHIDRWVYFNRDKEATIANIFTEVLRDYLMDEILEDIKVKNIEH